MISIKQILLKEYSEKVYKELITRYQKQNPNLDEDNIRYYIQRFEQLLGAIRKKFNDKDEAVLKAIPKELHDKDKYTNIYNYQKFTTLEHLIDIFPASKSTQKKAQQAALNNVNTDADLIWKHDNIEIYKGDSMHRCIKYGENEKYSWCISRAGETRSMYFNYRFQEGSSRMFYFVFDRNRTSEKGGGGFKDPFHAFVIHVFEKGKYAITNADNSGDHHADSWEELSKYIPKDIWNKIKGLKDLFKYIPPSEEEVELNALKGKRLTLEQFNQLSYNTKVRYLQNNAQTISTEIFNSLNTELKNLCINNDRVCTFNELKSNMSLLKRYPDYRFTRHPDEPLPYPFIPYLKPELQQLYYKKFERDYLTYDEIKKYFGPKVLQEYVRDQVQRFDFLPEEAIELMDNRQEQLYKIYSIAFKDHYYKNNGEVDDSTVSPSRSVQVSPLSYKSYMGLDPKYKEAFVNLIKKISPNLGTNEKMYEKWRNILMGTPTMFEVGGKLYIVTYSEPEKEDDIEQPSLVIMDEDGKIYESKFERITFFKDGEPIKENDDSKVMGSNYILNSNDFDSIELEKEDKSVKIPITKFKPSLKENKMKKEQVKKLIKEVIEDYIKENDPDVKPTIAPPKTKPGTTPKRRTLEPDRKSLPSIKPKAIKENEKSIILKITNRYNKEK